MADIKMQRLDGAFQLEGDINYQTVSQALKLNLFSADDMLDRKICVDFSRINNADSAALALMIHWLRQGKEKKIDVQFSNIPTKLIALAEMSNLETVLPLS